MNPKKQTTNRSWRKSSILLFTLLVSMAIPLYCHARQSVTYIEYVASANTGSSTASYVKLDNIKPTGKWKIKVDFSVEDASSIMAIFSCKRSTSSIQWKRLNLYNISGEYRLDMLADNGTGLRHLTGAHAVADFRQTFVYDAGKLYLDGRLVVDASSENGLLTADNREPIVIFGDPRLEGQTFTNLGKGKIYRVRMWDETGVEVCDLHPCLDSNDVAALYDSVNDTIHYSLGAAFKPGAVVPPEGVEFIEYVQTKRNTSGSVKGQWFNTGIIPEYGGRIEVDFASMEASVTKVYPVWRTYSRTGSTRHLSMIYMGTGAGYGLRCDLGTTQTTGRPAFYGVRRTYVYDAGVFSVDGNVIIDRSAEISSLTDLDHEIVLGATYDLSNTAASSAKPSLVASTPDNCNANFSQVRIYRFRYWDASGVLKSDLRPARDVAGTAALYDTVRSKFIYHLSGGAVAYTDEEYADYAIIQGGGSVVCTSATALEYVETQGDVEGGRQFFDTGFEPSGAAKFTMDVQSLRNYTGANYAFFTDRFSTSANKLNLYCLKDTGLRFDITTTKQATGYKPGTQRYSVLYNGGVLKFNDDLVWDLSTEAATLTTPTNRLFLFASAKSGQSALTQLADSNYAKARLYGMKIWEREGGTFLRDFEPRLDAVGVAGLYDKVGDKFYHSCSNVAVAGPRVGVPSAAQIEAAANVMADAVFDETGFKLAARSAFVQQSKESVGCPYVGKARTADCAYFPQSFTTTVVENGQTVTATTGYASLGSPFSSEEGTSWTAVMRVRRAAKGVDDFMDTVLSLGTECEKDRVRIGFSGPEAERRLDVRVGRYQWPELAGVSAPANAWFDIAVVANATASSVRVALCRSGEEPVWMEKSFAVDGISLTNMAARATWNVTLGGVAASSGSEVGRKSSSDTWTMFDSALEAFKGDVQSVALWNRALSDAEVYAAFSQAPATGLTVIIK